MSRLEHGRTVRVRVPATTANLGPAFDTLGLALGLYNTVQVSPASVLQVVVQGEGRGQLPHDENNLVVQAMCALFAHVGRPFPPFLVQEENEIPVSSGLGSSAAAVLAGLLAANAWLGEPLAPAALLALAAEIEGHPDNVAAALHGGLVLSFWQDGELLTQSLPLAPLTLVVVTPAFALATRAARAVLPLEVPLQDAVFNLGRTALLGQALAQGDRGLLRVAMTDRLHQPYRLGLIPGAAAVFAVAQRAGAPVALSGAGPSILAFAPEEPERLASSMRQAFAAAGLESRSWVLTLDLKGSQTDLL